jgi:hypothetical protein
LSTPDTAALRTAPTSLAGAFLALGDSQPVPPPPRRGQRAAAIVAALALVFAGPLPAAGLAAADPDDRASATLPAKTAAVEAEEDDGGAGDG